MLIDQTNYLSGVNVNLMDTKGDHSQCWSQPVCLSIVKAGILPFQPVVHVEKANVATHSGPPTSTLDCFIEMCLFLVAPVYFVVT